MCVLKGINVVFRSYSCVLKMTVSMEKPMEAASPISGLSSTVRMNVTTQTTCREGEKDGDDRQLTKR